MDHLDESYLKGYLDRQLDPAATELARYHLETCPRCQAELEVLRQRAVFIQTRLQSLESPQAAPAVNRARARLSTYSPQKMEAEPMLNRIFAPRWRTAWGLLALVLVMALSLAIPSVRAAAIDFLGLFRVQTIEFVAFDQANLPENISQQFRSFDQMLQQNMQTEMRGEAYSVASAAEASQAVGFAVRLPETDAEWNLTIQPGGTAKFRADLQLMQTILTELNITDLSLPAELDGAEIVVEMPDSVVAQTGKCQDSDSQMTNCVSFIQMPSPTISAPPGTDLNLLGQIYLRLLGYESTEAEAMSARINWATTLVVPVPVEANYAPVDVDGVSGALLHDRYYGSSTYRNFTLVWTKDEVIYAFSGRGSTALALRMANSLK